MKLPRISLGLVLVLLLIFLLRLPSSFEPYWYGDEQIYLAIGQAMGHGAVLYRDIWDNKPPLLYVLYAIVPTLLWAKALATVFVLGTCVGMFALSKSLARNTKNEIFSLVVVLATGALLSIPLLEGTIANAELFFTLPIVWGALTIFNYQLPITNKFKTFNFKLMTAGLLAAIAFLFKVPAAFDFAGMFLFLFVILSETYLRKDKLGNFLKVIIRTYSQILLTFVVPLVLVFAYFFLNHALKDFIVAAFSQNASYVSVDTGPLSKLSNPLFVKALILLLSSLVLIVLYLRKHLSKELLFLSLWFGFSLYGALLSGRPYMHYLLQIVPPATILVTFALYELLASKKNRIGSIAVLIGSALVYYNLSQMFQSAFRLQFVPYYQNYIKYVSGQKSWEEYASYFDSGTLNSYAIAKYINENSDPDDPIFVWGDAASIYVLSDRPAATRFIQAHHLTTIDSKNYDLIIEKLDAVKPKFIIVKRPAAFEFSGLEGIIAKHYQEVSIFKELHIYQRL